VFDAYTYQTKEIVDTLELFVQMTVRRRGSVVEVEDRPIPPTKIVLVGQSLV
jgi:hypothetical protein